MYHGAMLVLGAMLVWDGLFKMVFFCFPLSCSVFPQVVPRMLAILANKGSQRESRFSNKKHRQGHGPSSWDP